MHMCIAASVFESSPVGAAAAAAAGAAASPAAVAAGAGATAGSAGGGDPPAGVDVDLGEPPYYRDISIKYPGKD